MCTATYLPAAPNGFMLTHSRDEKVIRPVARPPLTIRINEQDVTFPQDPQGQGTWIAASRQTTACLLNGGFVPHERKASYGNGRPKHSRGLVVLHLFEYPTIQQFIDQYDFCNIEPFTLILAQPDRLVELRWNGHRLFIHDKDPQRPHIWSSVTLYTPDVIEKRERWFSRWLLQQPFPRVDDIRRFHKSAGDGDPENDLRMNRQGETITLSLTSIVHDGEQSAMIYEDLVQNTSTHQSISPAYATASLNP